MYKIILFIDGMKCGMCEAHVNDLIRKKINVKKITSNHKKGQTTIICDKFISNELLVSALDGSGYKINKLERCDAKKTIFGYK